MSFAPQDFITGNFLEDADLDRTQENINEIRRFHLGAAMPGSLVAGVRWIQKQGSKLTEKIWTGTEFVSLATFDADSHSVIPEAGALQNVIWNGDLDVWQDGASQAGIQNNTGINMRIADGWHLQMHNSGIVTVDRQTDTPTVAAAGRHLNFCQRVIVTTDDPAVGSNDYLGLVYTVEGRAYKELYQQPQCLSFWAKSNFISPLSISLRNKGKDRSWVKSFSLSAADTWQLFEFPVVTAPSGGTWNFDEDEGLRVMITLAAGGNILTASESQWLAGNFYGGAAQGNFAGAVNNYIQVADVRLHAGTSRKQTIVRTFTETLYEAQRRFWKTFPYDVKPAAQTGFGGAIYEVSKGTTPGDVTHTLHYPVPMRGDIPSIATYNPVLNESGWDRGGVNVAAEPFVSRSSGVIIQNADATLDVNGHRLHMTASARFSEFVGVL